MTSEKDHYQELIKLFLPLELFEYFEIRDLVVKDRSISVFLDEHDIKPAVYIFKYATHFKRISP
jgi:hypothetical protein